MPLARSGDFETAVHRAVNEHFEQPARPTEMGTRSETAGTHSVDVAVYDPNKRDDTAFETVTVRVQLQKCYWTAEVVGSGSGRTSRSTAVDNR